ncbi:MAG: TIGR00289 family protein [Thaumarchaeota archaeon]|nr:TIGR00289 family protein [Nitrososphaerota archaeon]
MKVGVLFSGGKDSAYAAYLAHNDGDELRCLITLSPSRADSYMFHYPDIRWTKLQAEAMHLPQVALATEGVKEEELADLKTAIEIAKRDHAIEGVLTGALASVYQKSRVERICDELGVKAKSPLWHIDPVTHLSNIVAGRFEVIVTGVAALGLDESWLGRRLDRDMIGELARLHEKYGVHPGLEGGEGETFVLDCPLFDRKIEVVSSTRHWKGDSGYLEILDARLVPKT